MFRRRAAARRAETSTVAAPATTEPATAVDPAYGTAPRRRGWRARSAGAAAVGTVGAGIVGLARLVMGIAALIAALIVAAILLRVLGANPAHSVVKGVHDGANFFAGSFTGLFRQAGHPGREIAINWGIAAVVYLVVGAIVSGVIRRIGRGGLRFERRHRATALP